MKFEYDEKEAEKECVAYISLSGDLVVKDGGGKATVIYDDGSGTERVMWNPDSASRRFYHGDKLTITF